MLTIVAVSWSVLITVATLINAAWAVRNRWDLTAHLAEAYDPGDRADPVRVEGISGEVDLLPIKIRLYGGPFDGETRGLPPVPHSKLVIYGAVFEGARQVYAYTGTDDEDGFLRFQHMPGNPGVST